MVQVSGVNRMAFLLNKCFKMAAASAAILAAASAAQAATITITNYDDTSSNPSVNIIEFVGSSTDLLGFVGAFASVDLGGRFLEEGYPSSEATATAGLATGYTADPNSNPLTELDKFAIVTGLSSYIALKDDSGNSEGSYQASGSDTIAVVSAEYFSLKYAGYLAFFKNDSGGALTINMWSGDCENDPTACSSNTISHVTEYISPVPVPASGLLLLGGLGGLVAMRRRKKLQKN